MKLGPRAQLEEQLDNLELNIEAYRQGRRSGWLGVANRLSILLCHQKKRGALVTELIPDFMLHPLLQDMTPQREKYLLWTPRVKFDQEGFELELFDFEQRRIHLSKWLKQTVAVLAVDESPVYITLEQLIREARNQAGGAHVDPSPDEVVQATSGYVFREKGGLYPFHIKCLMAIGEYLLVEIRKQLPSS